MFLKVVDSLRDRGAIMRTEVALPILLTYGKWYCMEYEKKKGKKSRCPDEIAKPSFQSLCLRDPSHSSTSDP
jgi:hypothetical protein